MTTVAELKRRLGLAVGALVALTLPAVADICATRDFEGTGYAVCTVDAADQDVIGPRFHQASALPATAVSAARPRGPRKYSCIHS